MEGSSFSKLGNYLDAADVDLGCPRASKSTLLAASIFILLVMEGSF